ncbi:MAG: hypothetical protein H6817_11670 [Phycisphaerales bacterium]|nr:hypothetical protein [Phycisphaerales bacterium]
MHESVQKFELDFEDYPPGLLQPAIINLAVGLWLAVLLGISISARSPAAGCAILVVAPFSYLALFNAIARIRRRHQYELGFKQAKRWTRVMFLVSASFNGAAFLVFVAWACWRVYKFS